MRIPTLLQRALNLFPPARGLRSGGGLAVGGRYAVGESDARYTAVASAFTGYLYRSFNHAQFGTERYASGEWRSATLTEWEMIKERPNALNAMSDILVSAAVDAASHGLGLIEMVRSPEGRVGNIWWAPAALTSIEYEAGGTMLRLYRVGGRPSRGLRDVLPEDMIRIQRGIAMNSPAEGVSPLAAAGDAVGAHQRMLRGMTAVLHNAARATIVMPVSDQQSWQQEEAEAMAGVFRAEGTGDNTGKTLVTPHRFDVANVTSDQRMGIFTESATIAEATVGAQFGVPPQVAGLVSGLRYSRAKAELEAAREVVYENVLMPIGREVADGLTRHLLPALGVAGREWRISVDWSGHPIAAAHKEARLEMMLKLLQAGVVNAQQVAEAAGVEYGGPA